MGQLLSDRPLGTPTAGALFPFVPEGGGPMKRGLLSSLIALLSTGKPVATEDQVVAVATGTKTVAQALAEVDSFVYAPGVFGTIQIPNGYVFTPADQIAVIGRLDMFAWLRVISQQFPTPHTTSGNFTVNIAATVAALFGFVNSGFNGFAVSVDDSANAGSQLVPFVMVGGIGFVMGSPFSSQCVFKGAGIVQSCSITGAAVEIALINADAMNFTGNQGAAALMQLQGGPLSNITANDYEGGNFVVVMHDGCRATIAFNVSPPTLSLSSGAYALKLGGNLTIFGSPTISAASGAGAPLTAIDSGVFTIGWGLRWKPLTSGEHFFQSADGDYGQPKRVILDVAGLSAVDTSVTAAFGNLVRMSTVYTTMTTVVEVLGFDPTKWGENAVYNITPNSDTSAGQYGTYLIDRNAWSERGLLKFITPDNEPYTLKAADFRDNVGYINFESNDPQTCLVPANLAISPGATISMEQLGAGQITVSAAEGVTINNSAASTSAGQFGVLFLIYKGANVWTLTGDRT